VAVEERQRFLRVGRERRVAADHADDQPDPDPRGEVVPVDEARGDQADQEAAGHIDRERRPRED
jgi:hypothetical protein